MPGMTPSESSLVVLGIGEPHIETKIYKENKNGMGWTWNHVSLKHNQVSRNWEWKYQCKIILHFAQTCNWLLGWFKNHPREAQIISATRKNLQLLPRIENRLARQKTPRSWVLGFDSKIETILNAYSLIRSRFGSECKLRLIASR